MTGSAIPPRRRFPIWARILAAALVIGAGLSVYYMIRPLDAPIPAGAGAAYAGLEQGYTAQGFPRLGSPDAPVMVEEFSSYMCPHCREFHEDRFPNLLDEIAAGQVQYVLIMVPHIGPGAKDAAKAAFCAGEQGHLWTMHDILFDWQKRFIVSTFARRRLEKGAKAMALDTTAFDRCLDDAHTETVIEAARNEFKQRGLSGTPSFFINGRRVTHYSEFEDLGTSSGEGAS